MFHFHINSFSHTPIFLLQVLVELPYIFAQAIVYGVITYAMMGFEWTGIKFFWYIFFMYFTLLYFTFYGMMTVAVTPNHHIAAIVSSAFYGLWNLFAGFIVPRTVSLLLPLKSFQKPCCSCCHRRCCCALAEIVVYLQKMPVWWRWYYWGCPVSWTLYGLVASQYGDVKDVLDTNQTVKDFVREYYGFKHDFVGVIAGGIVGISVLFAFIFGFSIRFFNFQRR